MIFQFKTRAVTQPAAPAEPIREYVTEMYGQRVTVRVFAPGASAGRARARTDVVERIHEMKAVAATEYEPMYELWSAGEK